MPRRLLGLPSGRSRCIKYTVDVVDFFIEGLTKLSSTGPGGFRQDARGFVLRYPHYIISYSGMPSAWAKGDACSGGTSFMPYLHNIKARSSSRNCAPVSGMPLIVSLQRMPYFQGFSAI